MCVIGILLVVEEWPDRRSGCRGIGKMCIFSPTFRQGRSTWESLIVPANLHHFHSKRLNSPFIKPCKSGFIRFLTAHFPRMSVTLRTGCRFCFLSLRASHHTAHPLLQLVALQYNLMLWIVRHATQISATGLLLRGSVGNKPIRVYCIRSLILRLARPRKT